MFLFEQQILTLWFLEVLINNTMLQQIRHFILFGLLVGHHVFGQPKAPFSSTASSNGATLNHGWDPVTQEFKESVLQLTHTGQRGDEHFPSSWVAPGMNGSGLVIADQTSVYDLSSSSVVKERQVFRNITSYVEWEKSQHSTLIITIVFNELSGGEESWIKSKFHESNQAVIVSESQKVLYEVSLPPPLVLRQQLSEGGNQSNTSLAASIATLPADCTTVEGRGAYLDFIDRHGPVYVSRARYGGKWKTYLVYRTDLQIDYDLQEDIAMDIALVPLLALDVDAAAGVKADLNITFRESIEVIVAMSGGNPLMMLEKNWTEWDASIIGTAAPVNVTYTPFYELIADPVIAANLKNITVEYLSSAAAAREAPVDPLQPHVGAPTMCGSAPGALHSIDDFPDPDESAAAQQLARTGVKVIAGVTNIPQEQFDNMKYEAPTGCLFCGFNVGTGSVTVPLAGNKTFDDERFLFYPYTNRSLAVADGHDVVLLSYACMGLDLSLFANVAAGVQLWLDGSLSWFGLPKIAGLKLTGLFKELQVYYSEYLDFGASVAVRG